MSKVYVYPMQVDEGNINIDTSVNNELPANTDVDSNLSRSTDANNTSTVSTEENNQVPVNIPENESGNAPGTGSLQVDVTSILGSRPISGATVSIAYSGQLDTPLEEVTTDTIGRTPLVSLTTPNIKYSLTPSVEQPYATYDVRINAPGYETIDVNSVEILADQVAVLEVSLIPQDEMQGESAELYVIPPHTLYGDYPPKIAESEIKSTQETGEIVLSSVVIPEFIVVHDGPPSDKSAQNYYVKYKDYIKNVASSEIYATWPEATIMANVLAIQSFVLNRVYTEWYRNKGYAFTITNSTAYDQKYIPGRNIFESISEVVDQIFTNYLARPDVAQPILTQFCDGRKVSCPNWMTQWGSKDLGERGYSAIEIIRYFYGDDMYIESAEQVSGVPSSWPGYTLSIGTNSDKVRQMQRQLNVISKGYPLIPKITADGIYGPKTAEAVKTFQQIFKLPQTGTVDFATWYKISEIYVGVSRIAELS